MWDDPEATVANAFDRQYVHSRDRLSLCCIRGKVPGNEKQARNR